MKLIKPTIFRFLIFLLLVPSCTQEIEITIPEPKQSLVIECFFHPYNGFVYHTYITYVKVNQTKAMNDTTTEKIVTNAIVKLWVSNNEADTLQYSSYDKRYMTQKFKPIPGDTCFLEVSAPGFETVYAKDIIPNVVNSKQVMLIKDVEKDESGAVKGEVTVTFSDPQDTVNYFLVKLFTPIQQYITSDDPVIRSERYYHSPINFDAPELDVLPFSDKLINGKLHNLKVKYTAPRIISGGVDSIKKHAVTVHFHTISEQYYKYMTTLLEHQRNQRVNIIYGKSEPMNVYSNIENGYGVFAGYQMEIKSILVEGFINQEK